MTFLEFSTGGRVAEIWTFLERYRDPLVASWEEKVRRTLATEANLTTEQLRDSLGLFFDEVIRGLRNGRGTSTPDRRSPIAQDHGRQRQILNRNIAELVREYALLLEAVVETAARTRTELGEVSVHDLTQFLFSGAADAVDMYAARQVEQERRAAFEYFAFVAHELRNPLSSVRMAWEALVQSGTLDDRAAALISRNLTRLAELIDHSITESRVTAFGSAPTLVCERVRLDELIADVSADSAMDAQRKRIRISANVVPFEVDVDRRLMLSALTNLLRNAIKFTPVGGEVWLRTRAAGGRLFVDVEDRCGGLPPERVEQLFEAFAQVSKDRSGFGLGLPISKLAIEAHGGTLSVKNVPGTGCIFTVDLPKPE